MAKKNNKNSSKKKTPTSNSSIDEENEQKEHTPEYLNNHLEFRKKISENEEKCFAIHSILFTKKRVLKHIASDDPKEDLKFIRQMSNKE